MYTTTSGKVSRIHVAFGPEAKRLGYGSIGATDTRTIRGNGLAVSTIIDAGSLGFAGAIYAQSIWRHPWRIELPRVRDFDALRN